MCCAQLYRNFVGNVFNFRNKQNRCGESHGACVQFNNYVNRPYNCRSSNKTQSCYLDDGNWSGLFHIHSNLFPVWRYYKVKTKQKCFRLLG